MRWTRANPAWLDETSPVHDVVVSTRFRLARNLREEAFPKSSSELKLLYVLARVSSAIEKCSIPMVEAKNEAAIRKPLRTRLQGFAYPDPWSVTYYEILKEKNLVSPSFAATQHTATAFHCAKGRIVIMVNEEDHLRLQLLLPGDGVGLQPFRVLQKLESELGEQLGFCFDSKLGYLTACASNLGTGLRVSVMLHLPALNWHTPLDLSELSAEMPSLEFRGLFGEGSSTRANFVQVSNRYTLGESCEHYIHHLKTKAQELIERELQAREKLQRNLPQGLERVVFGSLRSLKTGGRLSSFKATRHLSALRLGCCLGYFPWLPRQRIMRLLVQLRPGHLQLVAQKELSAEERDEFRGKFVKRELYSLESEGKSDLFPG